MKKILVILGHPLADTFSNTVFDTYTNAARNAGAEVRVIKLRELSFEINFKAGYRGEQTLEPDLVAAQESIQWCDHLVLIYPNWWSTFPALLKGFIDRTLLPGFAFKYRKGSLLWDKLLTGRSARIIVTMDTPPWYYRYVLGKPGHNAMKKGVLGFCGFNPVRVTTLGPIKISTEKKRARWLKRIADLGQKMQ
ncbi:MAG TPA: NAD(P)H-dependent oxidoreductase [Bacteroidales bacterium]|nr:NAD(P)H-dependent oxidoreductase [Bacteroidales bacterium]